MALLLPRWAGCRAVAPRASSLFVLTRRFHQSAITQKEKLAVSDEMLKRPKVVVPTKFPSILEPYKGVPPNTYSPPSKPVKAEMTILPNGIKVVSEELYSPVISLGFGLSAGSRNEHPDHPGLMHLYERMICKSTKNRTSGEIINECELIGINPGSASSRDTLLYHVDLLPEHLPKAMDILADFLLNPLFLEEEIQQQKSIISTVVEELPRNPYVYMQELLHEVAFNNKTLGRSVISVPDATTRQDLVDFVKELFVGKRMIFGGLGIPHKQLCEYVMKNFGHLPATSPSNKMINSAPAKYVGGFKHVVEVPSIHPPPPNHRPTSFVGFTFNAGTNHYNVKDVFTLSVLQFIMGGGTSFSTGGPGKGMYARLYLNVLNQHDYIELACAVSSLYEDAALFSVVASAAPDQISELTDVLSVEILNMSKDIKTDEFLRAKNQIKITLAGMLEQRLVTLDDLLRQVLTYGKRYTIQEMVTGVEAVTKEDVQIMAKRFLKTPPTIVAYGKPDSLLLLPKFEDVVSFLRNPPLSYTQKDKTK